MKSSRKHTRAKHGLGTAEAAHDRVGKVGVGEHDEAVSGREVHLIARYRENGSKAKKCADSLTAKHRQCPTCIYLCTAVQYFV